MKHRELQNWVNIGSSLSWNRAFKLAMGGPGTFTWLDVRTVPSSHEDSFVDLAHITMQCLSPFINFSCKPAYFFQLYVARRGFVSLFQMQTHILGKTASDGFLSHESERWRNQFEFWASNQIFRTGHITLWKLQSKQKFSLGSKCTSDYLNWSSREDGIVSGSNNFNEGTSGKCREQMQSSIHVVLAASEPY